MQKLLAEQTNLIHGVNILSCNDFKSCQYVDLNGSFKVLELKINLIRKIAVRQRLYNGFPSFIQKCRSFMVDMVVNYDLFRADIVLESCSQTKSSRKIHKSLVP